MNDTLGQGPLLVGAGVAQRENLVVAGPEYGDIHGVGTNNP